MLSKNISPREGSTVGTVIPTDGGPTFMILLLSASKNNPGVRAFVFKATSPGSRRPEFGFLLGMLDLFRTILTAIFPSGEDRATLQGYEDT